MLPWEGVQVWGEVLCENFKSEEKMSPTCTPPLPLHAFHYGCCNETVIANPQVYYITYGCINEV